jgi:hypothetical protein
VGQRLAPDGAVVTVDQQGEVVDVAVQAQVRPFGRVLAVLPPVQVSGRASAAVEGVAP